VSAQLVDDLLDVAMKLRRGWRQGQWAAYPSHEDFLGQAFIVVHPCSALATCWCLTGACRAVAGSGGYELSSSTNRLDHLFAALSDELEARGVPRTGAVREDHLVTWNDDPSRSQAEVLLLVANAARSALPY
jgi:hypothetical protein